VPSVGSAPTSLDFQSNAFTRLAYSAKYISNTQTKTPLGERRLGLGTLSQCLTATASTILKRAQRVLIFPILETFKIKFSAGVHGEDFQSLI
jgi:hypothetical protein